MTELMSHMRGLLATEGDYGFLMAADEFEDSNIDQNKKFAMLLRKYVDIQTYVRMSQPIPLEMANEFKALNDSFYNDLNIRRIGGIYGAAYSDQLGPFFIKLTCFQSDLASHLGWLEDEPVRELTLNEMKPGEDLKLILRNHRFQSLKRITIRPDRRMKDISGLAGAIREMTANSLISMTFEWGVNDRLGLVKAAFAGNKSIPKGAELFIQRTRVWIKK